MCVTMVMSRAKALAISLFKMQHLGQKAICDLLTCQTLPTIYRIGGVARVQQRTMRARHIAAAIHLFVGQTESSGVKNCVMHSNDDTGSKQFGNGYRKWSRCKVVPASQ